MQMKYDLVPKFLLILKYFVGYERSELYTSDLFIFPIIHSSDISQYNLHLQRIYGTRICIMGLLNL
jgi:hypothetical protein